MKAIIVAGAIANKPQNGGEAWVRLSWARGMQQLGFQTFFIEQITSPSDDAIAYFKKVTQKFGFSYTAALIDDQGRTIVGIEHLDEVAKAAQLLINISGHFKVPKLVEKIRRKAYIDIDPGYTQMWHEQDVAKIPPHDFYFTIANNIGKPDCLIPMAGINWRPILQPVVLEDWPVAPAPKLRRFTTIAAWRGSFGTVHYRNHTFGQKCHEFRKFIELPKRSPHAFEIALHIHEGDHKDRDALIEHGWKLADPKAVAADPQDFRKYVQQSAAEFSVAQGMYVDTNSGWHSDRTIRYLASGRPALVQSTGDIGIPVGEGLIQFKTLDEAIGGADRLMREYAHHSKAARNLAETYFDSSKVLGHLLQQVGVKR